MFKNQQQIQNLKKIYTLNKMLSTLLLNLTVGIVVVAMSKPGSARYILQNGFIEGGFYIEDPHYKPQDAQVIEGDYYAQDMHQPDLKGVRGKL